MRRLAKQPITAQLPPCIEFTAAGEITEIHVRGAIGTKFDPKTWNVTNTEQAVLAELEKVPPGKKISVRVNSRGGDVGFALGVYNAFKRRRGDITTYNDGYALSAASIIMLGGSKVVSPKSSVWMIHRASACPAGNCNQLQKAADALKECDDAMAAVYAERTGKTKAEMLALMDKETWMSGDKARQMGFADDDPEVETDSRPTSEDELSIVASYQNVPEDLRERLHEQPARDGGETASTKPQTKGTNMKLFIRGWLRLDTPSPLTPLRTRCLLRLTHWRKSATRSKPKTQT